MHLDIAHDPDLERVEVIYDDGIILIARRDDERRTIFSPSFEEIKDENEYSAIKRICEILLNLS